MTCIPPEPEEEDPWATEGDLEFLPDTLSESWPEELAGPEYKFYKQESEDEDGG